MRVLVDAGADANKQSKDGGTAMILAARHGSAEAMRLLVARGAALPLSEALHSDTPPAHAEYIRGAQSWTPLHRAADARDFAALFALLRERTPLHERHDGAVASPHARMRTALSIAASNSYPCAAPVDERCLALLRWHLLVPRDERLAASARVLLMGGRRLRPPVPQIEIKTYVGLGGLGDAPRPLHRHSLVYVRPPLWAQELCRIFATHAVMPGDRVAPRELLQHVGAGDRRLSFVDFSEHVGQGFSTDCHLW